MLIIGLILGITSNGYANADDHGSTYEVGFFIDVDTGLDVSPTLTANKDAYFSAHFMTSIKGDVDFANVEVSTLFERNATDTCRHEGNKQIQNHTATIFRAPRDALTNEAVC